MDNHEINQRLRDEAIRLGLCQQWQREWSGDWDEDKMIARYIKGIDFCLKNNYPSNDFILRNFSRDALRRGGLFVDDVHSCLNYKYIVVKGISHIKARYNATNIGNIYVTDAAEVEVTARGRSFVVISALGHAKVTTHQYDAGDIVVIRHSAECTIIPLDGVVRRKDELDWLQ